MTDKTVTIFTSPTCHFCHMAKELFKANNIAFTERDILTDTEARKELVEKSGQLGVPVILVGEEVVVGFDEPRLKSLLSIA